MRQRYYRKHSKKNLEALYITKIGKNEYELFSLECQAARLRRKVQLMQKEINYGRQINTALIEKQLDANLHPDVIEKQTEKQMLLWNRTQQAYQNGDIEELKTIKLLLDDTGSDAFDKEENNNTSNTLNKESLIKKIEKAISLHKEKILKIMAYIKELKSQFPFTIEASIKDKEWVNNKNKEIFEKQENIKSQIKELQNIIDCLIIDYINKAQDT